MNPSIDINERVDVVAAYYKNRNYVELCRPLRMRWRSQDISFIEQSLRFPTVKGKRMIHVFHESDGTNNYRLEFDAESLTWTLVTILAGEGNRELSPEH